MGRRVLLRIASGWLLSSGWIAGWSQADDACRRHRDSPSDGEFEDTAVATLNSKVDAAAQAAPAAEAAASARRRPSLAEPAATKRQPDVSESGDLPPEPQRIASRGLPL